MRSLDEPVDKIGEVPEEHLPVAGGQPQAPCRVEEPRLRAHRSPTAP